MMNTEETRNLPAILRDDSPVRIVSSGSAPPKIVTLLSRFDPDPEMLEREARRYTEHRAKLTPQEEMVLVAHKALQAGLVLIDLGQTMKRVPDIGENHPTPHWPLMGVARPDDKLVSCVRRRSGKVEFYSGEVGSVNKDKATSWRQHPFYEVEARGWEGNPTWYRRKSVVPTLPPELRDTVTPDHRIIWLAEWVSPERGPRVPRDPALLSHVAGGLYAVEAVWDLTPLEYVVLFGKEA